MEVGSESDAMLDIYFDTIPTLFSNYRARKFRTKTPGQRRAKFRNGRNPGNRSSSGRDSRQLSLSLSSIALELETRKFDTSTLCSASLLLLPPRLQYTVSFVRFFTHFELHILLVDTVTFNPNLWFAGELLVEDFSRVWMDARFSGKLSLHHAATYIVLAYPIPKPAF